MDERVVLFKRRYPNSNINVYKLRKLYRKFKIKKKFIRKTKILNRQAMENIVIQAEEYANDVRLAIEKKFRIVQLDECFVTRNTIPKTAWSLNKRNIELDNKSTDIDAKCIIAAVSREYGIDLV